jgi:hypothetical protein
MYTIPEIIVNVDRWCNLTFGDARRRVFTLDISALGSNARR